VKYSKGKQNKEAIRRKAIESVKAAREAVGEKNIEKLTQMMEESKQNISLAEDNAEMEAERVLAEILLSLDIEKKH